MQKSSDCQDYLCIYELAIALYIIGLAVNKRKGQNATGMLLNKLLFGVVAKEIWKSKMVGNL